MWGVSVGSVAQYGFLATRGVEPASVLEIGSKQYGSTQKFRSLFPDAEYVGVDLEEGENVDVVHNLEDGVGSLKPAELVICCSVLEHTPKPWVMAETLTSLTSRWLYVAVPWVWRYHPYPDDYFRFSFSGIKSLFPAIEWRRMYYATTDDVYVPAEQGEDNALHLKDAGRKYLPYLEIHAFGDKRGA